MSDKLIIIVKKLFPYLLFAIVMMITISCKQKLSHR